MNQVYARGDHIMLCILSAHALLAVYQAWLYKSLEGTICITGAGVGISLVGLLVAPRTRFVRIVCSVSLQILAMLFIYRFRGRPEIYLYQSLLPAILILYEDWLAILPCSVLVAAQAALPATLHRQIPHVYSFVAAFNLRTPWLYLGIALLQTVICSCWAMLQKRRRLVSEWQRLEFEASNACLQEALLTSQESELELTEQAKMLKQAREEAEEATRSQRDFLANMSHEIRTPMNGVLGMASMLLSSPLTVEQREYAEIIRSSSEALLTLLNDILDLAKIQQGHMTLEPLPTDIRKLAEDIVVLLFPRASEKHIELALRVAPDTPTTVMVDSMRLRQVLLNLVSNAIKFTNIGHVLLEIRPVERNPQSVTLRFSITDTGIGIPQEKLTTIFDRFTQADSSTTRRFGGTGLGLAIAQLLVELLGGRISVESRVGTGSCFQWSIPLTLLGPVEAPSQLLRDKHIVIMCSSPLTGTVLAETLESWGASAELVQTALDHNFSFRMAEEQRADAAIAYASFFQNQEAFVRYLKECGSQRVPILAVFNGEGDLSGFPRANISASLLLPLRSSSLLETLCQILLPAKEVSENTRPFREEEGMSLSPMGTRILVAEDNAVNRRVITAMLGKLGYTADLATTGLEALKMWEPGTYDLILMDCQMPEMDGYEATATIRRKERACGRPSTPIVALTANSMSGDREKCLVAGMDDHLPKPVSLDALRCAVERCIVSGQKVSSMTGSRAESRTWESQPIGGL